MGRSVRTAIVMGACLIAMPVLAQQGPMSPIYRTTPNDQAQPPASKTIAVTPVPPFTAVTTPARGASKSEWDDPAVATAAIPPPLAAAPEAATAPTPSLKRQERPSVEPKSEQAADQPPAAKSKNRATAPRRYARRYHVPRHVRYYRRWNYGYATAAVTGWGGGQFGPSPYSSTGQ